MRCYKISDVPHKRSECGHLKKRATEIEQPNHVHWIILVKYQVVKVLPGDSFAPLQFLRLIHPICLFIPLSSLTSFAPFAPLLPSPAPLLAPFAPFVPFAPFAYQGYLKQTEASEVNWGSQGQLRLSRLSTTPEVKRVNGLKGLKWSKWGEGDKRGQMLLYLTRLGSHHLLR